jgi:hypothetical protein
MKGAHFISRLLRSCLSESQGNSDITALGDPSLPCASSGLCSTTARTMGYLCLSLGCLPEVLNAMASVNAWDASLTESLPFPGRPGGSGSPEVAILFHLLAHHIKNLQQDTPLLLHGLGGLGDTGDQQGLSQSGQGGPAQQQGSMDLQSIEPRTHEGPHSPREVHVASNLWPPVNHVPGQQDLIQGQDACPAHDACKPLAALTARQALGKSLAPLVETLVDAYNAGTASAGSGKQQSKQENEGGLDVCVQGASTLARGGPEAGEGTAHLDTIGTPDDVDACRGGRVSSPSTASHGTGAIGSRPNGVTGKEEPSEGSSLHASIVLACFEVLAFCCPAAAFPP